MIFDAINGPIAPFELANRADSSSEDQLISAEDKQSHSASSDVREPRGSGGEAAK